MATTWARGKVSEPVYQHVRDSKDLVDRVRRGQALGTAAREVTKYSGERQSRADKFADPSRPLAVSSSSGTLLPKGSAAAVAARSLPKSLGADIKEAQGVRKKFRMSVSLGLNTKRLDSGKGVRKGSDTAVFIATTAAVAAASLNLSHNQASCKIKASNDPASASSLARKHVDEGGTNGDDAVRRLDKALRAIDEEGAALAKMKLMARIDADGNGELELQEMLQHAAPLFSLSQAEVKRLFLELDVDKNGTVDKAEFNAKAKESVLRIRRQRLLKASASPASRFMAAANVFKSPLTNVFKPPSTAAVGGEGGGKSGGVFAGATLRRKLEEQKQRVFKSEEQKVMTMFTSSSRVTNKNTTKFKRKSGVNFRREGSSSAASPLVAGFASGGGGFRKEYEESCPVYYGAVIALSSLLHGGYLRTDGGRCCDASGNGDPSKPQTAKKSANPTNVTPMEAGEALGGDGGRDEDAEEDDGDDDDDDDDDGGEDEEDGNHEDETEEKKRNKMDRRRRQFRGALFTVWSAESSRQGSSDGGALIGEAAGEDAPYGLGVMRYGDAVFLQCGAHRAPAPAAVLQAGMKKMGRQNSGGNGCGGGDDSEDSVTTTKTAKPVMKRVLASTKMCVDPNALVASGIKAYTENREAVLYERAVARGTHSDGMSRQAHDRMRKEQQQLEERKWRQRSATKTAETMSTPAVPSLPSKNRSTPADTTTNTGAATAEAAPLPPVLPPQLTRTSANPHLHSAAAATATARVVTVRIPVNPDDRSGGGNEGGDGRKTDSSPAVAAGRWVVRSATDPFGALGQKVLHLSDVVLEQEWQALATVSNKTKDVSLRRVPYASYSSAASDEASSPSDTAYVTTVMDANNKNDAKATATSTSGVRGGSGDGVRDATAVSVMLTPIEQGGVGRVVATVVSPSGCVTTVDPPASRAASTLTPQVVKDATKGLAIGSRSVFPSNRRRSSIFNPEDTAAANATSSPAPPVGASAASPPAAAATTAAAAALPPLSFAWKLEIVHLPECAPLEESHQATTAAVRESTIASAKQRASAAAASKALDDGKTEDTMRLVNRDIESGPKTRARDLQKHMEQLYHDVSKRPHGFTPAMAMPLKSAEDLAAVYGEQSSFAKEVQKNGKSDHEQIERMSATLTNFHRRLPHGARSRLIAAAEAATRFETLQKEQKQLRKRLAHATKIGSRSATQTLGKQPRVTTFAQTTQNSFGNSTQLLRTQILPLTETDVDYNTSMCAPLTPESPITEEKRLTFELKVAKSFESHAHVAIMLYRGAATTIVRAYKLYLKRRFKSTFRSVDVAITCSTLQNRGGQDFWSGFPPPVEFSDDDTNENAKFKESEDNKRYMESVGDDSDSEAECRQEGAERSHSPKNNVVGFSKEAEQTGNPSLDLNVQQGSKTVGGGGNCDNTPVIDSFEREELKGVYSRVKLTVPGFHGVSDGMIKSEALGASEELSEFGGLNGQEMMLGFKLSHRERIKVLAMECPDLGLGTFHLRKMRSKKDRYARAEEAKAVGEGTVWWKSKDDNENNDSGAGEQERDVSPRQEEKIPVEASNENAKDATTVEGQRLINRLQRKIDRNPHRALLLLQEQKPPLQALPNTHHVFGKSALFPFSPSPVAVILNPAVQKQNRRPHSAVAATRCKQETTNAPQSLQHHNRPSSSPPSSPTTKLLRSQVKRSQGEAELRRRRMAMTIGSSKLGSPYKREATKHYSRPQSAPYSQNSSSLTRKVMSGPQQGGKQQQRSESSTRVRQDRPTSAGDANLRGGNGNPLIVCPPTKSHPVVSSKQGGPMWQGQREKHRWSRKVQQQQQKKHQLTSNPNYKPTRNEDDDAAAAIAAEVASRIGWDNSFDPYNDYEGGAYNDGWIYKDEDKGSDGSLSDVVRDGFDELLNLSISSSTPGIHPKHKLSTEEKQEQQRSHEQHRNEEPSPQSLSWLDQEECQNQQEEGHSSSRKLRSFSSPECLAAPDITTIVGRSGDVQNQASQSPLMPVVDEGGQSVRSMQINTNHLGDKILPGVDGTEEDIKLNEGMPASLESQLGQRKRRSIQVDLQHAQVQPTTHGKDTNESTVSLSEPPGE